MSENLSDKFQQNEPLIGKELKFKNIKVDVKRFEKYLNDPSMNDAQKEAFLSDLLNIVIAFVDLGLRIHPVQQACEQNDIYDEICTLDLADLLESMPTENLKVDANAGASIVPVEDGSQK